MSCYRTTGRRLARCDRRTVTVEQQKARISAERSTANEKLTRVEGQLAQARSGLGKVHRLLDSAEYLNSQELVRELKKIPPLIRDADGLLASEWPTAPTEVMQVVSTLQPMLQTSADDLSDIYDEIVRKEGELKELNKTTRERIQRLESGESDLQSSTLQLIQLLGDHGIKAVPICDKVDVAEEDWRDALESFLGGHREALLVDPDHVRDAISVYRREGKRLGIYGSRIINTTKTDMWLDRRSEGSLAEVVRSDDSHALAYINLRAGNVIRVSSEDELVKHDRAITVDGMLATGGSVLRLRPEESMLGRKAKKKTLENLKIQFAERGQEQYAKQEEMKSVKRLREELVMPLSSHIESFPDLGVLVTERYEQNNYLSKLEQEESSLTNDASYQTLLTEKEKCQKRRDAITEESDSSVSELNEAKRQLDRHIDKLSIAEEKSSQVAEQRGEIQSRPGFDAQLSSEKFDELTSQEMFAGESIDSWMALSAKAESLAAGSETKARNSRNDARQRLTEYWAEWGTENRPGAGSFDDYLPLAAWVIGELQQIRETQLSQYVKEADTALHEAEHAFRADFVGKLQENLHMLDGQLRELNLNLKHRPFHGQYYRFIKSPELHLKEVLEWVLGWKPEQGGDVGGLFDAADDPNHPHSKAIERVRNLLMEAGGSDEKGGGDWESRLADYRNYYHFDVRMSDEKEGGKNSELLSHRLGKGSGGEHQSPFYVAIGAALAAAYRIERDDNGGYRGGMGIAAFDEAFSKLDLQNTVSALGFLDELGLQVLLAAPDEKYGQIAENVDTIVNVYRDGANVHIDAEYIKPAAKQVLASDNPVLRPEAL
jgi:uncharacterized protein YPO0396